MSSNEVVEFSKQKRRPSARTLVPLDKVSGAGRYYARMMRDVESDLGGKRFLTRIELELIRAFCGTATRLEYFNHQILLGDDSEVDLAGFSQLASTLLRIGSKLGLRRRAKDVRLSLGDLIRQDQERQRAAASEQEAQTP